MNIFKQLQKSRKNGLLSEKFNIILVSLLVFGVVITIVVLVARVSSYDSSLPLRYSTLDGYYDRGGWSRPYVIVLFTGLVAALHITVASILYRQKNYYTAKALLVVPLIIIGFAVAVGLHIVTSTTL